MSCPRCPQSARSRPAESLRVGSQSCRARRKRDPPPPPTPALAHRGPGASRSCRRAPPSLTRGRLPVSSSMALLASFMALCSGFAAPSPAAAAMAPGGGGRGDRGGAGASKPERGVCSRGSCGNRALPEGTETHFRLPRPADLGLGIRRGRVGLVSYSGRICSASRPEDWWEERRFAVFCYVPKPEPQSVAVHPPGCPSFYGPVASSERP